MPPFDVSPPAAHPWDPPLRLRRPPDRRPSRQGRPARRRDRRDVGSERPRRRARGRHERHVPRPPAAGAGHRVPRRAGATGLVRPAPTPARGVPGRQPPPAGARAPRRRGGAFDDVLLRHPVAAGDTVLERWTLSGAATTAPGEGGFVTLTNLGDTLDVEHAGGVVTLPRAGSCLLPSALGEIQHRPRAAGDLVAGFEPDGPCPN